MSIGSLSLPASRYVYINSSYTTTTPINIRANTLLQAYTWSLVAIDYHLACYMLTHGILIFEDRVSKRCCINIMYWMSTAVNHSPRDGFQQFTADCHRGKQGNTFPEAPFDGKKPITVPSLMSMTLWNRNCACEIFTGSSIYILCINTYEYIHTHAHTHTHTHTHTQV